ncbi:hypothetical protein [Flavobacterium sp.]|uniref:hypothetical protein n=1 Tax=Flavobacterium sp. TaxID=239 RepID=UPI0026355864|nr:hypothetical protein [Flavobacterium sp.]
MDNSLRLKLALLNSIIFFAVQYCCFDGFTADFTSYKFYLKILISLAFGFSLVYFYMRFPKKAGKK